MKTRPYANTPIFIRLRRAQRRRLRFERNCRTAVGICQVFAVVLVLGVIVPSIEAWYWGAR